MQEGESGKEGEITKLSGINVAIPEQSKANIHYTPRKPEERPIVQIRTESYQKMFGSKIVEADIQEVELSQSKANPVSNTMLLISRLQEQNKKHNQSMMKSFTSKSNKSITSAHQKQADKSQQNHSDPAPDFLKQASAPGDAIKK